MKYPAIVYQRDAADTRFAGNRPYTYTKRYEVTAISANVDSDIANRLAQLPMCTYNRFFTANSLNHDVFTLYF